VLKNRAYGRDPALCSFCKCSHIFEYAALSKTPTAARNWPLKPAAYLTALRRRKKEAPWPAWLSHQIVPSIFSVNSLARASP
jgi:hypothetical protein